MFVFYFEWHNRMRIVITLVQGNKLEIGIGVRDAGPGLRVLCSFLGEGNHGNWILSFKDQSLVLISRDFSS